MADAARQAGHAPAAEGEQNEVHEPVDGIAGHGEEGGEDGIRRAEKDTEHDDDGRGQEGAAQDRRADGSTGAASQSTKEKRRPRHEVGRDPDSSLRRRAAIEAAMTASSSMITMWAPMARQHRNGCTQKGSKRRFGVAAAEVGHQDLWQRAALGFAEVPGAK